MRCPLQAQKYGDRSLCLLGSCMWRFGDSDMEKIRREAEPRNYTVYSGDLIELKGERSVGTITQLSSFPSHLIWDRISVHTCNLGSASSVPQALGLHTHVSVSASSLGFSAASSSLLTLPKGNPEVSSDPPPPHSWRFGSVPWQILSEIS